jgi:tetratricopeptide (TPR) repeat protein
MIKVSSEARDSVSNMYEISNQQNSPLDQLKKLRENIRDKRKEDCGLNLAGMILSLSNNNSNDWQKPNELFDIFINAKDPKGSPEYTETLINSKECMMDQSKLRKSLQNLRKNDPSSALIVPLLGVGHLWSTVIRRTDEGFNAYVINKGLRFWHDPIEEFVFNDKNRNGSSGLDRLLNSLHSAKKPVILNTLPLPKSINKVYETFISNADEKHHINQVMEDQKVGNCFTINLYGGIKFYQATKDMPLHKWKENRMDVPYSLDGTKPDGKNKFTWQNSNTEELKADIIKSIAKNHPSISSKVYTLYDVYLANRRLRKDIKEGKDLLSSIEKNFNPLHKNMDQPMSKRLEMYFSLLSPHNLKRNYEKLSELAKNHGTTELNEKLKNINSHYELTDSYSKVIYMSFFYSTKIDPVKSLERLYDRDGKKTHGMSQREKMDYIFPQIHPIAYRKFKPQLMHCLMVSNKELPKEQVHKMFEQYQKNAQLNFKERDGRLGKLTKDLPWLKNEFPLIAKDLTSQSMTFVQLAQMAAGLSMEESMRDIQALSVNGNLKKLINRAVDIKQLKDNIKFILDYVGKEQNDKKTCEKYLDIALELEDSKLVHLQRAIAFYTERKNKEAIVELSRAISCDPDDPALYIFRSEMYHIIGNHEEAKKDVQAAQRNLDKNHGEEFYKSNFNPKMTMQNNETKREVRREFF